MIFLYVFLYWHNAFSFEVEMISSQEEILNSQQIFLKFSCNENELGVEKHSMYFSVDSISMKLLSWHSIDQSISVWNLILKKTQLIFSSGCTLCLTWFCYFKDQNKIENLLRQTVLYIACLVVCANGTMKLHTKSISLFRENVNSSNILDNENVKKNIHTQLKNNQVLWQKTTNIFEEFLLVEKMEFFLSRGMRFLFHVMQWKFILVFLFFLLNLIYFLYRYCWIKKLFVVCNTIIPELILVSILLSVYLIIYAVYYYITPFLALSLLFICFFLFIVYLYITALKYQTYLKKIRYAIASFLSAAMFPLAVQIFILYKGC